MEDTTDTTDTTGTPRRRRKASFQTRLILFIVGMLGVLQAFNLVAVYLSTRGALNDWTRQQLVFVTAVFDRQMADISRGLVEDSRLAALDYGFRGAVADRDLPTLRSVIDNVRQRMEIDRAILVDLEETVLADSLRLLAPGEPVPFPDLLERADLTGEATSVLPLGGALYRMAVVPVLAPDTIGWLVVLQEIDAARLRDLGSQTQIAVEIAALLADRPSTTRPSTAQPSTPRAGAAPDGPSHWTVAATTLDPALQPLLPQHRTGLTAETPKMLDLDGQSFVGLARSWETPAGMPPVEALFLISVDKAMQATRPLLWSMLALLAIVLAAALVGGVLVARSVAQPVRRLAAAAAQVGDGNYRTRVPDQGNDEIGALGEAFNHMVEGLFEREHRIFVRTNFDPVTNLSRRSHFEDQLTACLESGRDPRPETTAPEPLTPTADAPATNAHRAGDLAAGPPETLAVAVVRISSLPEVVRALGFTVGDCIAREIRLRLETAVGPDRHMARLGEESFAVLIPDRALADMPTLAAEIAKPFQEPIRTEGLAVDLPLQIGIALYPDHGTEATQLVQHALIAVSEARRSGRAYHLFDPGRDAPQPDRLSLIGELRTGLAEGQLQLHYQPKIRLTSDRTIMAEALIRWQHPRRGFLPPDEFIPLAEQGGAIHDLTAWVLREATRAAAAWRAAGLDLSVAVNLSARDLSRRTLPDQVRTCLAEACLAPEYLTLEITESTLMDEPDTALPILNQLAETGLTLSVDDFGTGYSSMSYLKRLPVQELKIDKSFVLPLANSREDEIIVRSTIDLGHNLGLSVVAEGVDDPVALETLKTLGCDVAQGFFFSRPVPQEAFITFARSGHWSAETTGRGEPS